MALKIVKIEKYLRKVGLKTKILDNPHCQDLQWEKHIKSAESNR